MTGPLPTFESFTTAVNEADGSMPLRVDTRGSHITTRAIKDCQDYVSTIQAYVRALEDGDAQIELVRDLAETVCPVEMVQDVTLQSQMLATIDNPSHGGSPWKVQIVVELVGKDRSEVGAKATELVVALEKGRYGHRPYNEQKGNTSKVYIPYYK